MIDPSVPRRPSRHAAAGAAIVLGLAFAGLFLAAPTATADGCALTDLQCATGSVGGVVDQAKETAGDAGNTVNDTVNDTVAKVSRTVDGVLHPGGGGGGGGDDGDGDGGGGGGGDRGRHRDGSGHGGRSGRGASPAAGSRALSTIGALSRARTHDGGSITIQPAEPLLGPRPEDRGGIYRAIESIALHIGLPLMLLLAISAAFVAIQDRLDCSDPKLSLAALDRGDLTFQ